MKIEESLNAAAAEVFPCEKCYVKQLPHERNDLFVFVNQLDPFLRLLHPWFLFPFTCQCRSWCWQRCTQNACIEFHTNHLPNPELRLLQGGSVHSTLSDVRQSLRRASEWVLYIDSAFCFSYKTVKPTEPAETGKSKSELFRRYFPYLKDKAETPNFKKRANVEHCITQI